ncbi:MAG: UDP-N-acetylmuramoyl-L-alanyl-D-glutamate--2,6-diaminopimelate ligase [Oscillospiraceae bacterium]|jgi:UDP-N-acetylmuramoyl-L-alanyl-D-glutamate--2,6-diaminopimelate ligase|nr:UDP-N-acetylmuramoyl-L-alanyl-D-glutamate--2,6-diaminopimelate ligase [Oscillospiraceae bacterium]
MLLSKLLECLPQKEVHNLNNIEIEGIAYDSRKAEKNFVFTALRGYLSDGNDFINNAIDNGACAIVSEIFVLLPNNITLIIVDNARKALALLSACFFGYPAKQLTTVAVTGTKGKTTTTAMLRSIFECSGTPTGTIGTLGIGIGKTFADTGNTTPESYEIHKAMADMLAKGCGAVVIEASSQGLKWHRTFGIEFDIGVFTNISPDHIGDGEHSSFEEYVECKSLLFKQCKTCVANIDDPLFATVTKNAVNPIITYGFEKNADFTAFGEKLKASAGFIGVEFKVAGKKNMAVQTAIPGKFNVYNALAAIAAAYVLNITDASIAKGLDEVKVKGRVEPVPINGDYTLLIDYAHNGASMENVLTTLRQYNPKRLVVMFGAGGNRPKDRRYDMGHIAGKLADLCVLTEDNSRFEDPNEIIADIETAVKEVGGKYVVVPKREDAIRYCIENAQPGDVIVLAGKGHETYHEIKGVKHHMDEREIVRDIVDSSL